MWGTAGVPGKGLRRTSTGSPASRIRPGSPSFAVCSGLANPSRSRKTSGSAMHIYRDLTTLRGCVSAWCGLSAASVRYRCRGRPQPEWPRQLSLYGTESGTGQDRVSPDSERRPRAGLAVQPGCPPSAEGREPRRPREGWLGAAGRPTHDAPRQTPVWGAVPKKRCSAYPRGCRMGTVAIDYLRSSGSLGRLIGDGQRAPPLGTKTCITHDVTARSSERGSRGSGRGCARITGGR
jgi:hypothetical protein